jgi:hypothetical protein
MTEIALLVKSYSADFEYASRLVESIRLHNIESIPTYIVVPETDLLQFQSLISPGIELLSEDLFKEHLVHEETAGFRPGYINQEIIKLAFWELGLTDNYFCVDSDAVFIRDFTRVDFMAKPGVPFTFLTEDRELQVEPGYYHDTWINRYKSLEKIREAIGYQGRWLLTVHGHAVFSAKVLESFKREFLTPRGWDYRDALAISPYEPTWYNTWLLHTGVIEIIPREPVVKTFHNATQHLDYLLRDVTSADLARGYLAVVVNSNFSRGDGLLSVTTSPTQLLAAYVSFGDLFRAFFRRFRINVIDDWRGFRRMRVWIGAQLLKVPGLRSLVRSGN